MNLPRWAQRLALECTDEEYREMMTNILRCWSCAHHRVSGCVKGHSAWPEARLDDCPDASYEPGTSHFEFASEAEYLAKTREEL